VPARERETRQAENKEFIEISTTFDAYANKMLLSNALHEA
jgi:hypothetical protein